MCKRHHCNHHCSSPHCGHCPCDCREPSIFSYFLDKICSVFAGLYGTRKFSFSEVKVAFIGNYNADCGISTYNEELIDGILDSSKDDKRKFKFKVFAEYADEAKSSNLSTDPLWVTRCWSRREHPKVRLIKYVLDFAPDIVHISHEYGLFPQAYQFTSLVSLLKSRGIKVIATMHSVYEHRDKMVSENAPDYIIVHTQEAKDCMIKKGIARDKISVIPHGSPYFDSINGSPVLLKKLWNTWGSEHTIFQAGFLFEYKGHARMMRVVAKLKEKYPDVHYIIQGSENATHKEEHNRIYEKLVQLAKDLDIEQNVTINRGFVTNEVLLSHIRTVTCCVLPYVSNPAHDVRATSGIARLILATETPLVVSDVHLFDDINDVVPVAASDDDFQYELEEIFKRRSLALVEKQARVDFLKRTSWGNVGSDVLNYYLTVSLK